MLVREFLFTYLPILDIRFTLLVFLEVEQTGTHTQFYDKFNIRYNISQIFNSIWNNQMYRNKLREESRSVNYLTIFKIINNENNIYLYIYINIHLYMIFAIEKWKPL